MARILNHKGNLSGISLPPPNNKERNPRTQRTSRISRTTPMAQLKWISASTASSQGITRGIALTSVDGP